MARNAAFSVLVFAELLRAFEARSETKLVYEITLLSNLRLFVIVAVSFGLQIWIHHAAALARLFGVEPISLRQCLAWIAIGSLPLIVLEMRKWLRRSGKGARPSGHARAKIEAHDTEKRRNDGVRWLGRVRRIQHVSPHVRSSRILRCVCPNRVAPGREPQRRDAASGVSIMSLFRTVTLGLAIAVAPMAGIAGADDHGLEQILAETATTPAQHQALAKYYRAKAADARAEAESHRTMAKNYSSGTSIPLGKQRSEHCEKIAKLADGQATEYDQLAASHETQAK